MRGARRCVPIAFLLLLLLLGLGIGSSQISANFALLGTATVYTKAPKGLLLAANAGTGNLWGSCAGALIDAYHIYSTTVGIAVSTVTFSTQKYAFGCAQLDAVTVATTSTQTVTTGTTVTETQTVTTGTTQTLTQTTTSVATETVTSTTSTTLLTTTTVGTTLTQTQTQTLTTTTQMLTTVTATTTKTITDSTTTVLQFQVQEGVYTLIAILLGSMVPLLARTAMQAHKIYRSRRVLRATEGPSGDSVQELGAGSGGQYRKSRRRALR